MKKKNEIRGNLYIQMPQPFRRQQLSLSAQNKNKQIRLKLEELNKKRNEHQELEQRWQEQKQNYEQFLNYHIQQDRALKIKEQLLRKQVFKLSIRKEQIESKTNPEIGLSKMKKLVQYLRCVPFTLGNYCQKVILWNGQREYLRYKFLFGYFVDRVLSRTEAQRYIKKNISNIVYCTKVRFQGEWIMLTLKLVDPQIEEGQSLQQSQGANKTSRNVYELSVYAITGKYFCYRKNYESQQLERWSDILQKTEREHRRHKQSRNTDENRRSSMAKRLAANCFKEISSHHKEHKSHHQRCGQNEQDKIEADNFGIAKAIEGKTIEEENQSQNNSHRQSALHGWSQNSVDANNNLANIYNQEHSDSSLHRDQSVSSNDSSEQVQKTAQKESLSTKKNVKSKSFFYSQTKYSENRFKALNKHCLGGGGENLFPGINPLLNIVILKEQSEIYLLQDYLQIKEKLQIINIALSRYRLKMKMKKQLRKCLFYKVIQFEDFYETKLKYEDKITLPIIFMVKKTDQKHKELRLSCTALAHHPRVHSILNFSHTFYRQRVVAEKLQSKDNRRISNNKLIKNNGRKSKQTRRRTISKNMLKSIEYQKSAFHSSKAQNSQAYAVFIRQKFDQFLKDNVISIERQCFIAVEKLKSLSRCLIRLQATLRKKMQLQRYRQTKRQIVSKYKYFPELKILLTARTSLDHSQQVKVVLQNVNQCTPPIYKCNTYLHKYKDTIFEIIDHFQLQQRSQQSYLNLEQQIKLGIDLQDEQQAIQLQRKPAKQRAALVRFLRMLLIRKKRKANIYFIRKMVIKDRLFLLIIRRNNRIRSLLQCNLYDFPAGNLKSINRDTMSEINCFIVQYPHSSKQFSWKSYRYQKIHLHERYFEGIERRAIADQFLIDYRTFLLKPAKQPSIHFIDRLCPFDINYEDINKELRHMERQQIQDVSNYKNSSQLSQLVSNKSGNNSSMVSSNKKSNEQRSAVEKESKRYNVAHYEHKKINKKISLIERNKELPSYARHNLMKDYGLQHTAQSVLESTGQKSKRTFKITGNSHESIIYFSLYKAKDIFFYLDIYLVGKQQFKCGYSEQLERVATQRIYKKQLEELGTQIVIKKIAEWLHKNEERLLETADGRQRNEEMEGKIELEGGLNMVGRCLQFLDSNAKRFSQTIVINVEELLEKQRGGRTNTLNL